RLKPSVKQLTSFYLLVSAGGAAGGVFVGIVAPRLFTTFLEFQLSLGAMIALLIIALIVDRGSWIFSNEWWLPATIAGVAVAGTFGLAQWIPALTVAFEQYRVYAIAVLVAVVTVLGAIVLRDSIDAGKRGFRFVQVIIGALVAGAVIFVFLSARPNPGRLSSDRSFYGVVQVVQRPGIKEMLHGLTTHGGQLDPPMQRMPILYYGPNSGIGLVLQNRPQRFTGSGLRIGVVGLGAGTLAAYGRPGDTISYYEINPDVVKLAASDHPVFTFIQDSAATVNVNVGDARLVMERELGEGQNQNFDVLALDAFNGDAIPVHLLTKEAFDSYWKHLNPKTGVIAVHITSRHVNLVPVLQGAANYLNVPYVLTLNHRQGPILDSLWFLMARNPEMLKIEGLNQITIKYVHNVGPRLWTDDYSDVFRLLY
ncbi:MAG: spermidine synthase, partial [Terriglobales bacterium]